MTMCFGDCFGWNTKEVEYVDETATVKPEKPTINKPLIDDSVKRQHHHNFNKMHNMHAFRRRGLFMFPFPQTFF